MFAKLAEHSDLMTRMAERAGADIGQALLDGRVAATEYRDRIVRCSNCEKVAACRRLLQATWIEPPEIPDYCANREFIHAVTEVN